MNVCMSYVNHYVSSRVVHEKECGLEQEQMANSKKVAKIAARKLQKKHPHARDIFCPEHDTTPVIHH